jgi:chromosome partitioning protein
MDILAFVANKGGVGKTTLAVHIAVAAQADGLKVLILDFDEQQNAMKWVRRRAKLVQAYSHPIEGQSARASTLDDDIADAAAKGFDLVILDTPPQLAASATATAQAADLTIVPSGTSILDLEGVAETLKMLRNTGLFDFALVVINKANHIAPAETHAAFKQISQTGIPIAPEAIIQRLDYSRALIPGNTAPELKPDDKHAEEIGKLWANIKARLPVAKAQRSRIAKVDDVAAWRKRALSDN